MVRLSVSHDLSPTSRLSAAGFTALPTALQHSPTFYLRRTQGARVWGGSQCFTRQTGDKGANPYMHECAHLHLDLSFVIFLEQEKKTQEWFLVYHHCWAQQVSTPERSFTGVKTGIPTTDNNSNNKALVVMVTVFFPNIWQSKRGLSDTVRYRTYVRNGMCPSPRRRCFCSLQPGLNTASVFQHDI